MARSQSVQKMTDADKLLPVTYFYIDNGAFINIFQVVSPWLVRRLDCSKVIFFTLLSFSFPCVEQAFWYTKPNMRNILFYHFIFPRNFRIFYVLLLQGKFPIHFLPSLAILPVGEKQHRTRETRHVGTLARSLDR